MQLKLGRGARTPDKHRTARAPANGARRPRRQALLAAALALPGLGVTADAAAAGNAPEEGQIGFKILYYQDSQPSGNRMKVIAPSVHVAKTVLGDWVIQGSGVVDVISGASPLYHSTLSGASGRGIEDRRLAADAKVTRYFERWALGVGVGRSDEHDYRSNVGSVDVRFFTPDKNTTLTLGAAVASDRIDSVNNVAINQRRTTNEFLVGITQVLSPNDIVQSNVTIGRGRGYFNDPYKSIDIRPDDRNQIAWLTRWNHHFESANATLRSSYRYYRDSWSVTGHTLGAEWVQSHGNGWFTVPSMRYATQSAADFYFDPPFPTGVGTKPYYSADQRLSAFGAVTPGLKLIKEFASGWAIDFKAEYYEQRAKWRIGGNGSPGLETFRAHMFQLGVSTKF